MFMKIHEHYFDDFNFTWMISKHVLWHPMTILVVLILELSITNTEIMASGPNTSWEIDGEQCQTLFFWAPKSLQMVIAARKLKDAYSLEGKLWPT